MGLLLLRKVERFDIFHCAIDAVADVGVEFLEVGDKIFDDGSVGIFFEGTVFRSFSVALQLREALQGLFVDEG